MKYKCCMHVIILVLISGCAPHSDVSLDHKIQTILDKGIKKHHERGVSTAIIFNDGRTYTNVSGISHDTVSMKPDMLFAIGSVTKNFVASLTLKLVEENVLSLEDPLSKWLPPYPYIDSSITIRQLLNHTSGIFMYWNNEKIWDDLKKDRAKVWTPEEVLSYIREPHHAPGEGWRYSNTNYLLLAMIIEKATGTNLSAHFRKYFWEPLHLTDVYLSMEDTIPDHMAHVFGDNFIPGNAEIDLTYLPRASHESIGWGSSGIFTTAESLAQWTHDLFTGVVLQKESMDQMLQFEKFTPVGKLRQYGLGVQVYTRDFTYGHLAIGHGGGNIGTTTYMVYLPDIQVSMAVMVNAFPSKSIEGITRGLIRTVLVEQGAFDLMGYFYLIPFPFYFFITGSLLMIAITIFKRRKSRFRKTVH